MAMGEVFISKSCKTYKNTVKSNDFYPLSYFPKLSSRQDWNHYQPDSCHCLFCILLSFYSPK